MRIALLALALSLPRAAVASPWTARVVALAPGAAVPSTDAVHARVGEVVTLSVALRDPEGVWRSAHPELRIDGRVVRARAPLPEGVRVAWWRVEPRAEHVDRPSPNPGVTSFSNAVLFGPRHGRWLGYDALEYTQRPLGEALTREVSSAAPDDVSRDPHRGAGSSWYAARVTLADGAEVRTPDADRTDRLGLSPTVLRVSFREDDSFAGWLSTYFHVASVFGSNGPTAAAHQTDRYTGADCADVLVGALRASGRRELAYTSVAGIGAYARPLTAALRVDAAGLTDARGERVTLRWGEHVRAGDLVTLDYLADADLMLPRAWDHIGALVSDDGDGELSAGDVLRHMGGHGLEDSPLVHGGPMRVTVWRWREATPRRR